jgi:hypothetical protein
MVNVPGVVSARFSGAHASGVGLGATLGASLGAVLGASLGAAALGEGLAPPPEHAATAIDTSRAVVARVAVLRIVHLSDGADGTRESVPGDALAVRWEIAARAGDGRRSSRAEAAPGGGFGAASAG